MLNADQYSGQTTNTTLKKHAEITLKQANTLGHPQTELVCNAFIHNLGFTHKK